MRNKYSYTMYGKAQFTHRKAIGFTGGVYSDDGLHVIGGRGQEVDCGDCDHTLPIPKGIPITYPVKSMVDGVENIRQEPLTNNHPHYDNDQADYLCNLPVFCKPEVYY